MMIFFFFLICSQLMRHSLTKLFHLSSCFKCLMTIEWLMLSSWATFHVVLRKSASITALNWSLSGASLVAQMVKNLPGMQETWIRFLGQKDALEKGMVPHSSILAWRIPWPEGWLAVFHVVASVNFWWAVTMLPTFKALVSFAQLLKPPMQCIFIISSWAKCIVDVVSCLHCFTTRFELK